MLSISRRRIAERDAILRGMSVRQLTMNDWAELWPLVQGFGTARGEAETRGLYEELVKDPRWAAFGYDDGGLIGYAVVQATAPSCAPAASITGGSTTST